MPNMKFLLTAVNSKYIHSNLAVRYIKKYCEKQLQNIDFMEFSINDSLHSILKQIYLYNADVICFSCYIWNIDIILRLCASLKKAKPEAIVVLGGPEVSFDAAHIMEEHKAVDFIISGEGEAAFLELAKQLESHGESFESLYGLTYRKSGVVIQNPVSQQLCSLDELPFPYEDLDSLENRIIYYETSRGCPFNCQYCLSSTTFGVRFLSMDRVKTEIEYFIRSGVKQVKLVDRTFNCNKARSLEIIEHIKKLGARTNFHFEIAADILNEELLHSIAAAPKGMFQFEIGVQTTNIETLKAIDRPMDIDKVKANVRALLGFGNAHIHLDLIAGLPYEDYASFKNSFNDLYVLKPHMLQLGFLKLLKGSGLRYDAERYGIQYHSFPPYEVIATNWLGYGDILKLKDVEHLLELYYNSGRFNRSIEYIIGKHYHSPFDFYEEFSLYWNCSGYYDSPKSLSDMFSILNEYAVRKHGYELVFNELLKLDWLLNGKNNPMPANIKRIDSSKAKAKAQELTKDVDFICSALPEAFHKDIKTLQKSVFYEIFAMDVLSNLQSGNEFLVFFIPVNTESEKTLFTRSISLEQL